MTNFFVTESKHLGKTPLKLMTFEFSLNVFNGFAEFSDQNYYVLQSLFEPATPCVRHQDTTTVPARHR